MRFKLKNLIYILFVIALLFFVKSSSSFYSNKINSTSLNKTVNLETMAMKIVEEEENRLYTAVNTYTGSLTGYAYNCPLCGGKLACLSKYDITNGEVNYNDGTYGKVRIVASSNNLPCGSIIRFNNYRISDKSVLAIVLDRGVVGYDIDLLVPSEEYALSHVGRSTINYEVLRSGWDKN